MKEKLKKKKKMKKKKKKKKKNDLLRLKQYSFSSLRLYVHVCIY